EPVVEGTNLFTEGYERNENEDIGSFYERPAITDDFTTTYTEKDDERVPPLYPIGQLQGTYILAQNERGFYMIDQHAAQARIKYEFFKKKVGETTEELQQLLMPLTFEFTNEEILFIQKHDSELQNAGLFLEPFGGQTYAVKAHPNWFPKGMEESVIRDLVNQVIHDGSINIQKLREEAAILMSCKRSIK